MEKKQQIGFLIILVAAIFSVFLFVILPALNMGAGQTTSMADQVVQDFYGGYLSYQGNPLVDKIYRNNPQLSSDFITFLDDFTSAEGMAFDPVLCAQDVPSEIATSPAQVNGDVASVEVTTSFADHGFMVELVQENGDWLINNVICDE